MNHLKRAVLGLILMLPAVGLLAQSSKEDVEIIQATFGKAKKDLVAGFVQLDPTKKDAFWLLYDQYETERKQLGLKRVAILEDYAANYMKMDDVKMDQIMKETQSLSTANDKLIVKYYGKIKKAAGVKPASQFYQLEGYLLSVVRATILENIPFIGELDEKW